MTQSEYFAKLCLMEAQIHIAKAYYLTNDMAMQIAALSLLRRYVEEVFNGCISQDGTKLYLAQYGE